MAKIIYGINGEGMGHAMRSKPILEYLRGKHDVRVFAGGRACDFLRKHFFAHRTMYYRLIYVNNKVSYLLTVLVGLLQTPILIAYNFKVAYYMLKDRPDVAISDFEPSVIYWASILGIPVVNIDNQHTITGTRIDVREKDRWPFLATRWTIRFIVPRADRYVSTTFFFNKITLKNLYLVPPILRDHIRKLKPREGDHVLVYQTSKSNKELVPVLRGIKEKFVAYGLGREGKDGNISFVGLDEKRFYRDLASCKAVIMNGGFTLMSEAIYLGKPVFANVIGSQFEQIINGVYLEKLGYGIMRERLQKEDVMMFLKNLGKYRKGLKKFEREDNSKVLCLLDRFIKEYAHRV